MTAAAAKTLADFQTIKLEVEDGIAILTLNRPDKMNSFTAQMMLELIEAFDITDSDDSVGAVIVTGAGDKAFCAGNDLKWQAAGGKRRIDIHRRGPAQDHVRAQRAQGARERGISREPLKEVSTRLRQLHGPMLDTALGQSLHPHVGL